MVALLLIALVVTQQGDSLARSVRRVDRLVARERLSEAQQLAREMVAIFPRSAEAWAAAGDVAGAMAGRSNVVSMIRLARECRARYEQALRLDSANVRALEGLAAYHAQAPRVIGGNRDLAFQLAKRLERVLPARGMVARAIILAAKSSSASTDSLVATALRTDNDTVTLARSITYFELTGRRARALELEMRLLARDSLSATRQYAAARLMLIVGDTAAADRHFRESWKRARAEGDSAWIAPTRPAWRVAQIAAARMNRAEAGLWSDSVLALDPRHAAARRLRDSLRVARP